MRLLPKQMQVMMISDPDTGMALQVYQGVIEPLRDPVQLSRISRAPVGGGGFYRGPPMGAPSGTPQVLGVPVQYQQQRQQPMQMQQQQPMQQSQLVTVSIPEGAGPGQPFQFVHPVTGQTLQATAPVDGSRVVQVQV